MILERYNTDEKHKTVLEVEMMLAVRNYCTKSWLNGNE